jgi:hypothetical protein
MSLHRWGARRDQAEKDIVDALRRTGWYVLYISVKNGPDLVIGRGGRYTHLVEVKTGAGKLRPGQDKFQREWNGQPVRIMRSVDDVIALNKEMVQ